jgi:hypothetical protein
VVGTTLESTAFARRSLSSFYITGAIEQAAETSSLVSGHDF